MNDLFTVPGPMGSHVPFNTMDIWGWLAQQPRDSLRGLYTVLDYLKSRGFIESAHRIDPDTLQCLEYAVETFARIQPHIPGPMRFANAFTPVDSGGFYVQGKPGRYRPNPAIVDALTRAGWIYDVVPETTYFNLIRETGVLWAQYQDIIGSRPIVRIVEG